MQKIGPETKAILILASDAACRPRFGDAGGLVGGMTRGDVVMVGGHHCNRVQEEDTTTITAIDSY